MLAKGLIAHGATTVMRDWYHPEQVVWGYGILYEEEHTLPKETFSALEIGQSIKLIDILESE